MFFNSSYCDTDEKIIRNGEMKEEYKKRNSCATCGSKKLSTVVELGDVPLAGYFPKKEELENISSYELNLLLCDDCGLVQTDSIINSDVLFKDYRYLSSIGLKDHFEGLANFLNDNFRIKDKMILDIGCNDGVLLEPLEKLDAICIGIDPSENVTSLAKSKGLSVITDYFNLENSEIYNFENKFDIITCTNTFAHIEDISSVLEGVKYSLKDDGKFIIEVHYIKNIIENNQWDNIYHEHMYYYSLISLSNFLNNHDMYITFFEEIENHSGSIRVIVEKFKENSKEVLCEIENEKEKGYDNKEYFLNFHSNIKNKVNSVDRILKRLKNKNFDIIGYGASGRANIFCNVANIDSDRVRYIIDESPERYGRYIANTNIPIYNIDKLNEIDDHYKDNTYVFIMAYNYEEKIMEKLMKIGFYNFIMAFPHVKTAEYHLERKIKIDNEDTNIRI